MMSIPEHFLEGLPDRDAAIQFTSRLEEDRPTAFRKLVKDDALFSDVLTLVSYSPLLATTLLQNPEYVAWLSRRRKDKGLRGKEELLESLARFALTNSTLDTQIIFARFRRRELLRIYLADIRRQLTIAEITEELSNLADAILEFALRLARQEMDNRFGSPQELDDRGRERPARFCVVTLGKLGSRELNYSSDIDLLFIY
jgi:glutamate-ammonia-ligase adenylyltransferase